MNNLRTKQAFQGRSTVILLFVALSSIYLLTANGRLNCVDGVVMYQLTRNITDKHSLAVDTDLYGVRGMDGRYYSKYGVMSSLVTIPFFLVGRHILFRAIHNVDPDVAGMAGVSAFNGFVVAATACLVFVLSVGISESRKAGLIVALAWGVGSYAWAYSKAFYGEQLCALLLTAAFLTLREWRLNGMTRSVWILGALLATLIATRISMMPMVFVMMIAVACAKRHSNTGKGTAARRLICAVVPLGLPLVITLGLLSWYNDARFGNPFDTGYRGIDTKWDTPLWLGVPGLLISPMFGLIWAVPGIVVSIAAWREFARSHSFDAATIAALSIVFVAVHCGRHDWHGGDSLGPRFLFPVVPLLLLPGSLWFAQYIENNSKVRRAIVATGLLALIAWQLPTVLVASAAYWYPIKLDRGAHAAYEPSVQFDVAMVPSIFQGKRLFTILTENQRRLSAGSQSISKELTSQQGANAKYRQSGFMLTHDILNRFDLHHLDVLPVYLVAAGIPREKVFWLVISLAGTLMVSLFLLRRNLIGTVPVLAYGRQTSEAVV